MSAAYALQVEVLKGDLQQQAALLQCERDSTIREVSTDGHTRHTSVCQSPQ